MGPPSQVRDYLDTQLQSSRDTRSRVGTLLKLTFACLLVAGPAHADEDAKVVFDRGTALFALHRFGEAAATFEKAFELRPDPAILYNAAQAHRLAGNNARALDLYSSLIRLYGEKLNRADIDQHIAELRQAIDVNRRAASSPPVTTLPSELPKPAERTTTAATPATLTTATPGAASPSFVVATQTNESRAGTPLTRRRWFWGVVAGGAALVVAGATIGIVVGTSKTVAPTPTFGSARGN